MYLNLLGAFYVTNPRTSKALAEASESTPFVWIDDAWVISYNNNDIAFFVKEIAFDPDICECFNAFIVNLENFAHILTLD